MHRRLELQTVRASETPHQRIARLENDLDHAMVMLKAMDDHVLAQRKLTQALAEQVTHMRTMGWRNGN